MDVLGKKGDVVSDVWTGWHDISWRRVRKTVGRLQVRIAKAARNGDWRAVRRLQRLLVRSTSAKALAVRRVTENLGRRTPGVDRETWSTPSEKWEATLNLKVVGYRTRPLRRVYIPKANGKKRPLGIPTMRDRAMQALFLLALEPVAETKADPNSYGFRVGRCTADAIVQCQNALGRKHSPQWVLDADIKGCFDNISHDWLEKHIPIDKVVLRRWLKAGYMEQGRLFPTQAGTPQGGIISPVLANMTLDGLERLLKSRFKRRDKVNFVRYADDFIVTGSSKELLETQVKPLIEAFLEERGLALSKEKTRVVHIEEGFDFLGWNVRRFKKILLITPSKKNRKAFYQKIRETLRKLSAAPQDEVIRRLNPIIRGWAEYHRSQMAKRTFSKMDHKIFGALWRWAKRRHPNKNRRWIRNKYFCKIGGRDWVFASGELILARLSDTKIRRHVKIRAEANPYDPVWEEYFEEVLKRKMRSTLMGRRKLYWVWKQQDEKCPWCDGLITKGTGWHVHHIHWRTRGGDDNASNLVLMHPNCHRQLHSRAMRVAGPPTTAEGLQTA
ncbi:group II intron reverse transcriptase/maturase [Thiohalobacter sp.]|uniref:group II intron reverse transcriptase/maturase n=1 Tax=Thiohalobacter sp. TaxID=2025948 RepID=UPI00262E940C|nr:group II intron reverse transcriptase/maturase [Thiohalobacter sp.]